MHRGRIAVDGDRERLAARARLVGPPERFVERRRRPVDVTKPQPPLDTLVVDLDEEADAAVQGDGERLRAPHAPETSRQHQPSGQRAAEVLPRASAEGLVGPLKDALRADVNPGARRHLAVHGEAHRLVAPEVLPVAPLRHEERVGDEHAWRVRMGLEHTDGLSRLD